MSMFSDSPEKDAPEKNQPGKQAEREDIRGRRAAAIPSQTLRRTILQCGDSTRLTSGNIQYFDTITRFLLPHEDVQRG